MPACLLNTLGFIIFSELTKAVHARIYSTKYVQKYEKNTSHYYCTPPGKC